MTTNLLEFDLEGLAVFCEGLGEKRFRATQLFRWIQMFLMSHLIPKIRLCLKFH